PAHARGLPRHRLRLPPTPPRHARSASPRERGAESVGRVQRRDGNAGRTAPRRRAAHARSAGAQGATAGAGGVRVRAGTGVAAAVALLEPHFRRPEAHGHAADYLRGLIADVERKNGWQLAERVGYDHPRGIQRVLDRYAWDAAAVRAALRQYVVAEMGDSQ